VRYEMYWRSSTRRWCMSRAFTRYSALVGRRVLLHCTQRCTKRCVRFSLPLHERLGNMLKKIAGSMFLGTSFVLALLVGPSFNFTSIPAAVADPIIVTCNDGSTPNCSTYTNDQTGRQIIVCTCG
jgi:hypothetical protein